MNTHRITNWIVPVLVPAMILAQLGCSGAPPGGASSSDERADAPAAQPAARDGEAVFRGVFFGQGAVAKLFPETWGSARRAATDGALTNEELATSLSEEIARMKARGSSDASIAKLVQLQARVHEGSVDAASLASSSEYDSVVADAKVDRLVASIQSTDPSFFDSFGNDMQSGDHVAVQAAFQRAQAALRKAVSPLRPT